MLQPWAILEFGLALAILIGCIAFILSQLHMVERAEEQKLWSQLKEKVATIR